MKSSFFFYKNFIDKICVGVWGRRLIWEVLSVELEKVIWIRLLFVLVVYLFFLCCRIRLIGNLINLKFFSGLLSVFGGLNI